jgi:hypothetical protein
MSIERPLHANLLESLAIEFFNESFLRKHYDAVTINHSGYSKALAFVFPWLFENHCQAEDFNGCLPSWKISSTL